MSRLPLLMGMPRLNHALSRPIFSLFRFSCNHYNYTPTHCPLSFNISSFFPIKGISNSNDFNPKFSTLVLDASSSNGSSSTQGQSSHSMRRKSKKERYEAPENVLKQKLDMCSKHNNLPEALNLYELARANEGLCRYVVSFADSLRKLQSLHSEKGGGGMWKAGSWCCL